MTRKEAQNVLHEIRHECDVALLVSSPASRSETAGVHRTAQRRKDAVVFILSELATLEALEKLSF